MIEEESLIQYKSGLIKSKVEFKLESINTRVHKLDEKFRK